MRSNRFSSGIPSVLRCTRSLWDSAEPVPQANKAAAEAVAVNTYGGARTGVLQYLSRLYPWAYSRIVTETAAKRDQYDDLVKHLPEVRADEPVWVLEPGPSPRPLLEEAMARQGKDVVAYPLVKLDRFARMLPPQQSRCVLASLGNLPFCDGVFDAVCISSVLIFVADRDRALAECLRVLKPRGRVVITELDDCVRSTVTEKLFSWELQSIKQGLIADGRQWNIVTRIELSWRFLLRLIPRLPAFIVAWVTNKLIVRDSYQMVGFARNELHALLAKAGARPLHYQRTYADAYHLYVGEKPE